MLPGLPSSRAMLVVTGTFQPGPVGKQMSNPVFLLQVGQPCHILYWLLTAPKAEDPEVSDGVLVLV